MIESIVRSTDNFLTLLKSDIESNFGLYDNAAFDMLPDEANTQTDTAARAKMLKEAERIVMDETAAMPIYYLLTRNVVSL